jgi:DNA repair protein RadC
MLTSYENKDLKALLAESLSEKQGSYMIEELFQKFPITSELVTATEQQLICIKGIGIRKARRIIAMLKLAKAITLPVCNPYTIKSPQDVYNLLESEMRYLDKEHFVCVFLSTKNHVISTEVVSIGSLNSAIVHPREVFKAAIKFSSASILCVHNHPSGDPTPSPEDIELTNRLVEAGAIIGIEVLDHLIFGSSSFYSLKEKGFM